MIEWLRSIDCVEWLGFAGLLLFAWGMGILIRTAKEDDTYDS